MKRIISWLVAAASFAAFAEAVPTYNALTWSVPASSIAQVDAKYVQLYATCDGVRVGSDARNVYAVTNGVVPDVGITATTIVNGEGGWDWTGRDVRAAVFAVEFLNDALGVIATSDAAGYDVLLDADALVVNQSESGVPVNAEGTHTFANVNVSPDDIWKELKSVFGAAATVIPLADASTNIVAHKVTLKDDVDAPLVLKANLGHVVIDLKGYGIVGTNAVDGTAAAGGNAIEISDETLVRDTGAPTTLEILDTAEDGYRTGIVGGRGASAATGTAGGFAVKVADGVDGVTVKVGPNAIVKGGDSGNSATALVPTAGTAALSGATLAAGSADAPAGADGTSLQAWAKCACDFASAELVPSGTTLIASELYIWRRTDLGAATFDFGEVAGHVTGDGRVDFLVDELFVDGIEVPDTAGDLTFVGLRTELVSDIIKSVFTVDAAADQTVSWTNLVFTSTNRHFYCTDGCAINMDGGRLDVSDCCFTNCVANHLGGAIRATRLDADSRIAFSDFFDNGEQERNCYGGALYASASAANRTLTLANVEFRGNAAERGGAVSTLVSQYPDEKPIALVVTDSLFADNSAEWAGGAVDAEGDLRVEADATHTTPGSTTFSNNVAKVYGGAISVEGGKNGAGEYVFSVPTVVLGRGTVFIENAVTNEARDASGGAIELLRTGAKLRATGVAFTRNTAYGSGESWWGVYGGAYDAIGGDATFDTCTFDGNGVSCCISDGTYDGSPFYYGGAICASGGTLGLTNSTFRRQSVEAVAATGGRADVLNCVLVGNGVGESDGCCDLYATKCVADFSYSAWGDILLEEVELSGDFNLTNRNPVTVYEGDTLYLSSNAFNAVAALGYEQPGVYDFDGVEYGSRAPGYAMGAFESSSTPAEILVTGTKTYDGHADSNGCAFVNTYVTSISDPDLAGLGDVATLVTVTNWVYGAKDAYAGYAPGAEAPHVLEAAADGNDPETRRWIAAGLITLGYVGNIDRRSVYEGGLRVEFAPDEYAWTGDRVTANLTVVDTLPDGEETLERDTDYALVFTNNVNPTSSAVAAIDSLRNYTDVTNALYHITAYFVEYAYDGVVDEAATRIHGETSGVEVVVLDGEVPPAPEGYAFDLHNSPTNGVVKRYADGLLRLQVQYCTDANGDDIPDKYQRRILAKVVNGYWSDANLVAADQVRWATMTNATGLWSESGTGTVDGALPTKGTALTGFSDGAWLAFVDGKLAVVADPASQDVSHLSVPFLMYAFKHGTNPRGSSGRGFGGKGTAGAGTATAPEVSVLEQYKASLDIVDATVTCGQYVLTTKLVVNDTTTKSSIDVPVNEATFKVMMTDALGKEWTTRTYTAEGDGKIRIDLTGRSGFYKLGL